MPRILFLNTLPPEKDLSQSTVNAIVQDQRGFMWFGTNDGLDKYDGYTIERFSHEKDNINSLNKNAILSLYEDKDGMLWIGTYGGGLNRFDFSLQQFTHFEQNPSKSEFISNNQVFEIFEDSEGVFWMGTEQGVDRFYKRNQNLKMWTTWLGVPFGKTEAIAEDRLGDIWIAGGNGIFRYKRLYKSFEKGSAFPKFFGSKFPEILYGKFMLTAGAICGLVLCGALSKFDYASGEFRHFKPEGWPEFPGRNFHVRNIYEDRQNNLWIGTDGAGVLLFDRQSETFSKVPEMKTNREAFQTMLLLPFLKTKPATFGLERSKAESIKLTGFPKNFKPSGTNSTIPNSLPKSDIKAVYQDEAGITWVGTEKGGLSKIDRNSGKITTWLNNPADENSLPDNVVLSIVKEPEKTLDWNL
jgi:two-component system, sensor histidine kinase ChiS